MVAVSVVILPVSPWHLANDSKPVPILPWSMITVLVIELLVCPWPITIDSQPVPISYSPIVFPKGCCNSCMAAVMGRPFSGLC